MNTDSIFTLFIFSLLCVLIIFIVRVCIVTGYRVKLFNRIYSNLQWQIELEESKSKENQCSIQLLEEYKEILIMRLFIIIKDLLFTQKLKSGKHDK